VRAHHFDFREFLHYRSRIGVSRLEEPMTYSSSALEILRSMPVATIWEAAGKTGDVHPRIRPMVAGARLAGPAYTVKIFPGETFGVLRAIDAARAGSVIVVDSGGAEQGVCWGGTATLAAQLKGLAGCVTNGTVRDLAEIQEMKFPIFAAGTSLRAGLRGHQGWIDIPVSIGEVSVHPGDVVFGDIDGVVVVPQGRVDEVAAQAVKQRDKETERDARLRRGEPLVEVLRQG
jgi:4-hydroxy-4-methyl-2-oxoglutarate aldolase